jgi:hypothetical protein
MKESRELMPDDVPDVYVLTNTVKMKLLEYFEENEEIPHPLDGFCLDRLCGIPFESYETLHECQQRAFKLRADGKNVALVCE